MVRKAKETIRGKALELGFQAVGFAAAAAEERHKAGLREFLGLGLEGDMAWLARDAGRRADPKVLWPAAKTVIALAVNYAPPGDPLELLSRPRRGSISVYARSGDYHGTVKKRLKALAGWLVRTLGGEVKVFTDTAPVMEKPIAQRAGIGWQGKHTNLVSRKLGSWFFLGEVFTTLALPPDEAEADHCGTCDACMRACPTVALPQAYRIDPRRCISYLTIEHKGAIAPDLMARMGNRIYGCDDCLAACPWNKFAEPAGDARFLPRMELTSPALADLCRLDDTAFRKVFAGSAIKRTGRDRFVRNVLVALGNSGDETLRAAATERLDDESPLVRDAAAWAVARLGQAAPSERKPEKS